MHEYHIDISQIILRNPLALYSLEVARQRWGHQQACTCKSWKQTSVQNDCLFWDVYHPHNQAISHKHAPNPSTSTYPITFLPPKLPNSPFLPTFYQQRPPAQPAATNFP